MCVYIYICLYTCAFIFWYMSVCMYVNFGMCPCVSMYFMYILMCVGVYRCIFSMFWYGVATISRLLKIIGLFCKRDDTLQKRPIILRSLLIVATPYASVCIYVNPKYFGMCPCVRMYCMYMLTYLLYIRTHYMHTGA